MDTKLYVHEDGERILVVPPGNDLWFVLPGLKAYVQGYDFGPGTIEARPYKDEAGNPHTSWWASTPELMRYVWGTEDLQPLTIPDMFVIEAG